MLQEFNRFGSLSNFKVYFDITEALNISLPSSIVTHLCSLFSFQWQSQAIKYLGTLIPQDLQMLASLKYVPLTRSIIHSLGEYDKASINWLGRINVLKMDVLSKILYLLQAVNPHSCSALWSLG